MAVLTGGVKPLKDDARKTVLTIKDCGKNPHVGRFVVSCYGWHRGKVVGDGDTIELAVRDWCRQTGNDFETVIRECAFQSRRKLPESWQRAEW